MDEARLQAIAQDTERCVRELAEAAGLKAGQLLVIGASTSEVIGRRIGTAGTTEVAAAIYAGIEAVRREIGFHPVFQCCEHLNRALVVTREAAERYGLVEVSAVPVPGAGGAMAAYAYRRLQDACLVESVQAHAGLDIGDTLIGMHLRPVAVPVRPSVRTIGEAHVTMARTRPKLIGGARAVYVLEPEEREPEKRV
ncbi:MAG: TIGR01440 family protein [Thermobacillus sp. ZCTH02-B1]|uniref:TIGR01440 family protein n=1 Tax=Thermobacillus sp. ZCTH02-B1 TaxID=1858795 RepID=UPI000B564243|nr:TIGR01440 family protein [Thermobacillus sp. ZCTH02-B1]OUM94739.1 MAG: TIGR01440 family protein [Thermobacillus sp. ZCTH02-B1]